MHPGQLSVPILTVRTLIAEQFPQWRHLHVQAVPSPGTVNAIFRVGDQLAARFLLEPDDVATARERLQLEAVAAEELLNQSPFATPRPIAIGEPGVGYLLPWSIYTWLPGDTATADNCRESDTFAIDLGSFISAVRAIDTRERAYGGKGRGGDLLAHDEWMQECLTRSEGLLDVATCRAIWTEMRGIPRGDSPDLMNHGDLIPPNILTAGGHIIGVLDVGGLRAADPALDLVSAWHLLDTRRRQLLRDYLSCDDAEWQRGRAWAFEQAMGAVWYYAETNPTVSMGCRRTLERIVTDMRA
ncbi:aminoglycoside phosphotransferase family protein [Mycobacterium riyadhense]|uniref:aminoglycoside phosphotransferase family protein n=1 Tax=Mycobacterium riyadhense TaxID=486698 RepID=UPI00195AC86E|nr:aminoglycoside phosphotransferase family protein [Mycobacterium riyadhense]